MGFKPRSPWTIKPTQLQLNGEDVLAFGKDKTGGMNSIIFNFGGGAFDDVGKIFLLVGSHICDDIICNFYSD